ncbi:hypothetical protein GM182_00370 [bacterium 3DAC]|nr:hypothetical protein [Dictyoglomota bacterium]UZN22404.1 hypothetical protein GM182_00370 [bacterium 3DAC]
MESVILEVAIIILTGYLLGILANKIGLPRVTGYIFAGLLLNPFTMQHVFHIKLIEGAFVQSSTVLANLTLAIITFEVGGSLAIDAIKRLGKNVAYITVFEAEFAFIAVITGLYLFFHYTNMFHAGWRVDLALALVMGALASPTDPSATLAVMKQYKARGEVSSMIMMIAAFDDALGIINFSIAMAISAVLLSGAPIRVSALILDPTKDILLSIAVGFLGGIVFKYMVTLVEGQDEDAMMLPVVLGMLFLVFGLGQILDVDSLMAIMTTGAVIVNWCARKNQVFAVTDHVMELVFIVFFVVSGLKLDFSVLGGAVLVALLFAALRITGKFLGVFVGATLAGADDKIKKYTAGGLVPQGGIVVGLALLFASKPEFQHYGAFIVSVTIGATIFHEIIGPLTSRMALKAAGEIK